MLVFWQAVAFTACVLFDLVPNSGVQCQFDVPVVRWGAPPPEVKTPATPPVGVERAAAVCSENR